MGRPFLMTRPENSQSNQIDGVFDGLDSSLGNSNNSNLTGGSNTNSSHHQSILSSSSSLVNTNVVNANVSASTSVATTSASNILTTAAASAVGAASSTNVPSTSMSNTASNVNSDIYGVTSLHHHNFNLQHSNSVGANSSISGGGANSIGKSLNVDLNDHTFKDSGIQMMNSSTR